MAIDLDTLDANASLDTLQTVISQKEKLGFELITLARGVVKGLPSNTASFLVLDSAGSPGPLTLEPLPADLSLDVQQARINTGPNAGKRLISYGALFVDGKEINVAAYRG